MKPLVSIVIPVYNTEKYLLECLDSLVEQTYKKLEIICVDDGSTDSSREIIRKYERKDARIRLEVQEHSNAGAARNKGLKIAKGEFIAFLDSDDFFEPAMIEKMVEKAMATQSDCVICCFTYYDNESRIYNDVGVTRFRKAMVPDWNNFSKRDIGEYVFRLTACAWDKLYRTAFLKENQILFQEQSANNDMLFTYKTYIHAERMAICPDVAVRYRTNNVESLQGGWGNNWQCIFDALTAVKDWLLQQGVWEQLERGFVNYAAAALTNYMEKLSDWKQYVAFFEYLRKEGIEKLELFPREEKDYYVSAVYKKIAYASKHSCEEYLLFNMISLSKANRDSNFRLASTKKQLKIVKDKLHASSLINRSKHWYFQEERLPEKSRIVVYGFGEVGRDLTNQFSGSGRLRLMAVIDQDYERFDNETIGVRPFREIHFMEFDYIIIAIHDREMAIEVSDMLVKEGRDRSKVVWFEMEL